MIQTQVGARPDIASRQTNVLNGSSKQERSIVNDDLGKAIAAKTVLLSALSGAVFCLLLVRLDASGLAHIQTPTLEVADERIRSLKNTLTGNHCALSFIGVVVLAVSRREGNSLGRALVESNN